MKLRNKKTGLISNVRLYVDIDEDGMREVTKDITLEGLYKDFEDYEDPKDYYWYIGSDGVISGRGFALKDETNTDKMRYAIGNKFETKEEAKDAVEKLKAIKELKKAGLKMKGWSFEPDLDKIPGNIVTIEAEIPYIAENMEYLDKVFGK